LNERMAKSHCDYNNDGLLYDDCEDKKEKQEAVFKAETPDIVGELTIRTKYAAILFINGIIDQFEIDRNELDSY